MTFSATSGTARPSPAPSNAEGITFLDALASSLRAATEYNSLEQAPPAAVLWPDAAREWEPLIVSLRQHLPVYTLGVYDPAEQCGPVAWLRCVVAGALSAAERNMVVPVLYLPGVGAADLTSPSRHVRPLDALFELCYRGVIWVTRAGRDWTVHAFLSQGDGGLDIESRADTRTRSALLRALPQLASVPLSRLREEAPWRPADFDGLVPAHEMPSPIVAVIAQGESVELEFKSTARWDVREGKQNIEMEKMIVKTVAAFLNNDRGGRLLIGVADDGTIHGVEDDYRTFKDGRQNRDQFELWLRSKLNSSVGKEHGDLIAITFHSLDQRTVCDVTVKPSPSPVYVTEEGKDVFYRRDGNATQPMGVREAIAYARRRWPA